MKTRVLALVVVAAALIFPAAAAGGPIAATQAQRIAILEAKVAALDTRVTKLEATPAPSASSTPAATPRPTATPAPTPSPTPTPPPAAADPPWATALRASMTTGVTFTEYTIACTPCSGAQLNAFIAASPNGASPTSRTRITVATGSQVNLTGTDGIYLKARRNLELVLAGVNVSLATDGSSNLGSGLFLSGSSYVAVRGGTFQGQNLNTGTPQAPATVNEKKSGASIRYGSDHVELDGITWLDLQGFGIFISCDDGIGGPNWPKDVWVHGSVIEGGEMGFGVVCGRDLLLEDNAIVDTSWSAFDFEPDFGTEGYEHVLAQRNTILRFGWEALYPQGGHTHWLLAMNPADGAVAGAKMDDLIFRYNVIPQGHVSGTPGSLGGSNIGGGGLLIRATKANVKTGTVITGNISEQTRTDTGAPVIFNAMAGLVLTGNTQFTVGGVALYAHQADGTNIPDSSVVATPNVTK